VARKRNHPGNTRQVYPRRLRGVRTRLGWTQKRLAEELERIAFPMNRATIAKIEAGKRPLEVSELVALATALDVAPAALFLPLEADTTALTDGVTVDTATAAAWSAGDAPLDPANAHTYALESPKVRLELTMRFRTSGTVTPGPGRSDG
jgi:transcriptional regulator with XRE-family HTH domain